MRWPWQQCGGEGEGPRRSHPCTGTQSLSMCLCVSLANTSLHSLGSLPPPLSPSLPPHTSSRRGSPAGLAGNLVVPVRVARSRVGSLRLSPPPIVHRSIHVHANAERARVSQFFLNIVPRHKGVYTAPRCRFSALTEPDTVWGVRCGDPAYPVRRQSSHAKTWPLRATKVGGLIFLLGRRAQQHGPGSRAHDKRGVLVRGETETARRGSPGVHRSVSCRGHEGLRKGQ